ncbi:MAG: hypothetical protein A2Z83_06595 [Omnitrophica bacterium GWA2_52_8]|nr:MAG: hypothetical protein A2Z83_06595 [Omnitrophica bacterium GWA2_52_8]
MRVPKWTSHGTKGFLEWDFLPQGMTTDSSRSFHNRMSVWCKLVKVRFDTKIENKGAKRPQRI